MFNKNIINMILPYPAERFLNVDGELLSCKESRLASQTKFNRVLEVKLTHTIHNNFLKKL